MIRFLKPWCDFVPGQGPAFLKELAREIPQGHELEGLELVPLGHSGARDDALFGGANGRVFQVHLTWSGRTEPLPFPDCQSFSDADEWISQIMLPANAEHGH
jgi:hypothetical protein